MQFVIERDARDVFRFATLQGPLASEILARHGRDPGRLETVVVVLDPGTPTERLLIKARAVLYILKRLGGPWSALRPFGLLPDAILNLGYDAVARVRYRVFGKHDECPLPNPAHRHKYLDTSIAAS